MTQIKRTVVAFLGTLALVGLFAGGYLLGSGHIASANVPEPTPAVQVVHLDGFTGDSMSGAGAGFAGVALPTSTIA